MSLDVYLTMNIAGEVEQPRQAIFIRRNGSNEEISREEWDSLRPGVEPITAAISATDGETKTTEVYTANITHNLGKMAREAGIYDCLWRPDEIGVTKASQLIPMLELGLRALYSDTRPSGRFRSLNPENGWGDYDGLCKFAEGYLAACREYPHADVSVWR